MFILEDADGLPPEEEEEEEEGVSAEVRPLGRRHLDVVAANWNYTANIGEEKVSRSLSFAADAGLCHGTFVAGQLVSWVVTTK